MQPSVDELDKPIAAPRPRWWEWISGAIAAVRGRRATRRLRLCETLALGDKRFVAVIEFENQQFLVGGGTASVNLLARLGESSNFSARLAEWCERQR